MSTNKFLLTLTILFVNSLFINAQVDNKYLAGAVPLIDGKVVFTREIKVSDKVSEMQLLQLVNQWAKEEFAEKENSRQRILLSNDEEKYLAAQGDEYLVFKSGMLMLDRATISYQLIVRVEKGKCSLEIRNIKYEYQDYKKIMSAEELITDKQALHKSGEKLNRHYDKFRTFTIDRVDELKNNLLSHLSTVSLEQIVPAKAPTIVDVVQTASTPVAETKIVEPSPKTTIPATVIMPAMTSANTVQGLVGFKEIAASEIASGSTIENMMKDSWALVTVDNGKSVKSYPAAWKGQGSLADKAIAEALLKGANVEANAVYTISFYSQLHQAALMDIASDKGNKLSVVETKSGAKAYGEAWLIVECKKALEYPSTEAMADDAKSKKWDNTKLEKLYIGEIINIWVR